MTEQEVGIVESALSVKLPPHYRRFLLNFPSGLFRSDAKDGDEWQWLQADSLMFHTVRSFIEYNRSVREPGRLPLNGETAAWPGKFFIIGTNGDGDYWCIDLEETGETGQLVYEFDHERGQFRIRNWLEKHAAKLQRRD